METIQATGGSNNLINWLLPNQSNQPADQPAVKINNRISILYADGNRDACLMLQTLLGFSGIEVTCAATAKEAFQAAQKTRFGLYLLDLRFTDGSGLELCRRLHELDPQVPVVFYSGLALDSDRQQGLAAGAEAYLVKPRIETIAPTIFKLVTHFVRTAQEKSLATLDSSSEQASSAPHQTD